MSGQAANPPREPFLALPGFSPDALGFAVRTTAAMLLAYFIAFWVQLDSASTAGLCVAIVAQSSPGMAFSKAIYRVLGTVLGGIAAIAVVSAFGQDRTLLLVAFTFWLGGCTFIAALLRDFRSYGAVLCGYTVGIIAISNIDAPQDALITTLDRVAAILLGVVCVAGVNAALSRSVAYDALVASLRAALADMRDVARGARAGEQPPGGVASGRRGAAILALTTQAGYAATELPDGAVRIAGARAAIAAMLEMLSATHRLAQARATAPMPDHAGTPAEAFLLDRAAETDRQAALAEDGLRTLETGHPRAPPVRLGRHYDAIGAAISAIRTMIAVGLGCVFCILSGWPSTTGILVQQAAFTALLGMQQDPARAGVSFGLSLPLPALAAGVVGYLLLPEVSGFVPFALAVGSCVFVFALLGHHPRTAEYGPGLLLYFALLLGPSNTPNFDFSAYLNNVLSQIVAVLFMVLAFRLIVPVSRQRRLMRIADAMVQDLRRTMLHGRGLDAAAAQSVKYDQLAQALSWLGRPTPARAAVFSRLYAFAELDVALRRAWSGLDGLDSRPGLDAALQSARTALLNHNPAAIGAAAQVLLDQVDPSQPEALGAVSGLYGAQDLLRREDRAIRRYRVLDTQ